MEDFPIRIRQITSGPQLNLARLGTRRDRCLEGIRVLDMSRLIAAPVAGRTLAAHGAEVLWITSPFLPDLPTVDCDCARGKRTA